jgi:hypothetical protein
MIEIAFESSEGKFLELDVSQIRGSASKGCRVHHSAEADRDLRNAAGPKHFPLS